MGKLHIKGYILQTLNRRQEGLWDHQIAEQVLKEYGLRGPYWRGNVRLTLTDLYAGGLLEEMDQGLDDGSHFGDGKVLFKFRLSPFGLERMRDTGLA
jgi:hypothetical protein